jgi:hypothetical protein
MTRLDFTAAAGAAESVAEVSAGAGASTTGAGADDVSCTGAAVGAGATVGAAVAGVPSVAVDSSELTASSPDFFAAALPVAAAFLGALTGFTSSG